MKKRWFLLLPALLWCADLAGKIGVLPPLRPDAGTVVCEVMVSAMSLAAAAVLPRRAGEAH